MDYSALKTLIETHPGYPAETDENIAIWCNEEAISVDKATLPATDILSTILNYESEWNALTASDQATVRDVLYIASGEGVPTAPGNPIRAILVAKLGTDTKAELAAKIGYQISRAENVGILGTVNAGHVAEARTW